MPAKRHNTIPVPERALMRRINRLLEGEDAPKPWNKYGPFKLVALKGAARDQFGKWVLIPKANNAGPYRSNAPTSGIEKENVDLEAFGRELGVLQPWEEVVA